MTSGGLGVPPPRRAGGERSDRGNALDAGIASRLKRDANGLFTAVAQERGTSSRSGHTQYVHSLRLDCDGDTVLLEVDQVGGACHTGDHTCFDADLLLASED